MAARDTDPGDTWTAADAFAELKAAAIDRKAHELEDARIADGRCQGCGASWVGAHGAFACGAPLGDCPAQSAHDDDWADEVDEEIALEGFEAERAAELALEQAHSDLILDVSRTEGLTDATCKILDALEEDAFGGGDTWDLIQAEAAGVQL